MIRQACCAIFAAGIFAVFSTAQASGTGHYNVLIVAQRTQNMTFSNGVFMPTGDGAILGIADLERALAAGNVTVTTGNGASGDEPGNITINRAITWATGGALTLDAYHSLIVHELVVSTGGGGVSLTDNDGGAHGRFQYSGNGKFKFYSLSSPLTINGNAYTLVGSVQSLATAIASQPGGFYALANDYNAAPDGTYAGPPVPTKFTGTFDALGHTIYNLTTNPGSGLFNEVDGAVNNLTLGSVAVQGKPNAAAKLIGPLANTVLGGSLDGDSASGSVLVGSNEFGAGLVGYLKGTMAHCQSSATVNSFDVAAGLVGFFASGIILDSSASGAVKVGGQQQGFAGGLVGVADGGTIAESYATGAVSLGKVSEAGGLVGGMTGTALVINSYATGAVSGGNTTAEGGLIGYVTKSGTPGVQASYATGAVTTGHPGAAGGVLGYDNWTPGTCGCFSSTYWDTTTSGIAQASQGAGNVANEPGLLGLTNAQLQAALPAGFDPTVWALNPSINNGLPYLIANPPL
jgi:hypothetical protein